MLNQEKKRIAFALSCFVIATITAVFLVKSIFFSNNEFGVKMLPSIAYFTIQANIFATIWLIYIGLAELKPTIKPVKPIFGFMVSCYITVTGIIYWLVLVPMLGFEPYLFSIRNIWMHAVMAVLIPSVFMGFVKAKSIAVGGVIRMLIYPICYTALSYILYAITGLYTYPFLNPIAMGGGIIFAIGMIIITALFIGLGFLYRYVWNKRNLQSVDIIREQPI